MLVKAAPGADTTNRIERARRLWAVLIAISAAGLGLLFALFWLPVVHGKYGWASSADIWGTFRDALYISWGSLSYVYSANGALIALPGFPILLAPFAAFAQHLGMTWDVPWAGITHYQPTALLVLWFALALVMIVLVLSAESVLGLVGSAARRKRLVLIAVAALAWPGLELWGHGEDFLALALALIALRSAFQGWWVRAGWLLGGAIAVQPLAVLVLPLLAGIGGLRRAPHLIGRALFLPMVLFVAVAVPDFHHTWYALTRQPNWPTIDWPTPWVRLAPSLGHGAVAAGPSRIVGIGLAVVVGIFLGRRFRDEPAMLLWTMAVAFGLRCIFESVMVPYYVAPAAVTAVIAAAGLGSRRWWLTFASAMGVTVQTFHHGPEWAFWSVMTGLLILMLAAGKPISIRDGTPRHRARAEPPATPMEESALQLQCPPVPTGGAITR